MRRIFVVRNAVVAVLLLGALVASASVQGDTSQISALRIERDSNGSPSFVISKSGVVRIQDFMMGNPPRLVLDFVGSTYGMPNSVVEGDGKFVERVRSSQFAGAPDLVARVVFDLKDELKYQVKTEDQQVTVRFYAGDAPQNDQQPAQVMESSLDASALVLTAPVEKTAAPVNNTSPVEKVTPPVEKTAAPVGKITVPVEKTAAPVENDSVAAPKTMNPPARTAEPVRQQAASNDRSAEEENDKDVPMMTSWDTTSEMDEIEEPAVDRPILTPAIPTLQSYAASAGLVANRNITIDVQEADIQTVLRSFSEFSNTNIVAGPEVEGKVTAHLINVPWRQAMDIILKAHGFAYREEYGMIRVSTTAKLTKEELELQAADRQRDDLLPLETRIIQLSFARASEIREALKEILSQRGSIEIESGMNSLIVNDISKNIEKIAAMVVELDRKIKQVEIVAKLIDVDFDATREMGVRWDLLNLASQQANAVGDFVLDARSAAPTGTFRIGTVQSWGEVQAVIDMLEKENKANIISNPRIVTAENREASILVGKQIPLIVADEAGNPITELTKIGIILRVTPHVNLDNTITLDLHPEVSDLSSQATVQGGVVIVMSEADTRVVVANGETAVIGGLISEVESTFKNGVPILKDIPVIGGLFRLTSDTKKKRELVIFVTPKIVGD
jgi:type IV pilus assembly protein PilQ